MAQIQDQLGAGDRLAWRLASTGCDSGPDKRAVFAFLNRLEFCLALDPWRVEVTTGTVTCRISRTGATYEGHFVNGGGDGFAGGAEVVLRRTADLVGAGLQPPRVLLPGMRVTYVGPDMQLQEGSRRLVAEAGGRQAGCTTFERRLLSCLACMRQIPETEEFGPGVYAEVQIDARNYGITYYQSLGDSLEFEVVSDHLPDAVMDMEGEFYGSAQRVARLFVDLVRGEDQRLLKIIMASINVVFVGPDMRLDGSSRLSIIGCGP